MKKEDIGLGILAIGVLFLVLKIATYDFASVEHKKHEVKVEDTNTNNETSIEHKVEAKIEEVTHKVKEVITEIKEDIAKVEVTNKVKEVIAEIKEQEVVVVIDKKVQDVKKVVADVIAEVAHDAQEEDVIAVIMSEGSFTRDGDLISDSNTKLTWQDDEASKNTVKALVSSQNFYLGDYNNTMGDTAEMYCENLNLGGHSDFRLPTITELKTLVNPNSTKFVYDIFQNITKYNYWSSSISEMNEKDSWYLYTSLGYSDTHPRSYSLYVRCVRDN